MEGNGLLPPGSWRNRYFRVFFVLARVVEVILLFDMVWSDCLYSPVKIGSHSQVCHGHS